MNLRLIDLIPLFSFIFFSRCVFSALLKIEVCQILLVGCFRKLWVSGPMDRPSCGDASKDILWIFFTNLPYLIKNIDSCSFEIMRDGPTYRPTDGQTRL